MDIGGIIGFRKKRYQILW